MTSKLMSMGARAHQSRYQLNSKHTHLLLMKYFRQILFFLGLGVLLSSCLERDDSLAPIITITSPANGTVRSADDLRIFGYAMDDEGIVAIRVDQDDILTFPIYQNEYGRDLVRFGFRPNLVNEGQWQSNIEVEDSNGNITTLQYILEIDTTPPVLELSPLVNLGSGRWRVTGTASDNQLLERISINDTVLSFAAVQERPFSLDVDSEGLSEVTVLVRDQAGNEVVQTLTP